MKGGLLIDTGYLIALFEKKDEHHKAARRNKHLLETHPVVLPWPVLYETINTRFAKRSHILTSIHVILAKEDTLRLDDSPYREAAYRQVRTSRQRPMSLVDAVLRAVIDGKTVPISALLTFNPKDFDDLCREHRVVLPCQNAPT